MEEKKLTEKESLELITTMIARTRERYVGDGRILLMWGYLVGIVSILVWVMLAVTGNHLWNYLWFAIPVIGGTATPVMARKLQRTSGVKTYSDVVTSRIWVLFGASEGVMILLCLAMQFIGNINCWSAILAYSLVAAPFAEIAQGIFIRENSLTIGGLVGLAGGVVTLCCISGGVPLYASWFMPMFIICFVAMMIVPGHIINHKARESRERA